MDRPVYRKDWGQEKWIENNGLYCLKEMLVLNFGACSLHYHKEKDETFYVVVGEMILFCEGDFRILGPGDSYRIRPYREHSFFGIQSTSFFEASTHHKDEDSYRLFDSMSFVPREQWERMCTENWKQTRLQPNV